MTPKRKKSVPPTPAEMRSLLAGARSGDLLQFGKLLNALRPYLLAVANAELNQDLWAKVAPSDLVQETLLEVHNDFAQFPGSGDEDIRLWARKILLNNIQDAVGRFATLKREFDREQPLESDDSREQLASMPDERQQSPSTEAVHEEEAQATHAAIEQLPEDYRLIIRLHAFEKRPFAEIASMMDRSEKALRMLYSRALAQLGRSVKNRIVP